MLLTYKKEVMVGSLSVTKKILIGYRADGEEAYTTMNIFSMNDLLSKLRTDYAVKVAVFQENTTPVLVVPDETNSVDVSAVQQVLYCTFDCNAAAQDVTAVMKRLVGAITPQLNGDTELAKLIVSMCKLQYAWEKTGEIQSALFLNAADYDKDFRELTIESVNTINARFSNALAAINVADNSTVFQETCTSKLFIEIPSRTELDMAQDIHDLMPVFDELCKPYSVVAATKPGYASAFAGNQGMLHDIEGDRSNNTFKIFDNEREYYDALCQWVKYNMKEQYGTADGDVIDMLSEKYLAELITTLYMLHWRHSDNVPDEIDDSASDDLDCESRYLFFGKENTVNGVIVLLEFLKEVSAEIGYKAYVDAVIQIARWGARKPTAIVFDGVAREFNLGLGMVKPKMGDLSQYSVIQSNGKNSRLAGLIVEAKQVRDNAAGFSSGIPVGVLTETKMKNSDGASVVLSECYHFVDFITLMKNGQLSLDGVSYDKGAWSVSLADDYCVVTVSDLIASFENMKDSLLKSPFYRSPELIELYSKVSRNTAKALPNLFTIVNGRLADPSLVQNTEKARFTSYNDILNIIADQSNMLNSTTAVLEYCVIGRLLPLYQEISKIGHDNFLKVLETWDVAMSLYDGLPVVSASTSDAKPSTEKVTSFGDNNGAIKESVQTEVKTTEAKSDWLHAVPADAEVIELIMPDGKVVGYCMAERIRTSSNKGHVQYTILAKADGHRVVTDTKISIYRIMSLILHNIYMMQTGSSVRQVYFADVEAMNVLKVTLNTASKEMC